jgi:hypothetical protein
MIDESVKIKRFILLEFGSGFWYLNLPDMYSCFLEFVPPMKGYEKKFMRFVGWLTGLSNEISGKCVDVFPKS